MAVEYGYVNAFLPYACAVYTCACGREAVKHERLDSPPEGWRTHEGTHICPRCSEDMARRAGSFNARRVGEQSRDD
jgi:hypothetical protein